MILTSLVHLALAAAGFRLPATGAFTRPLRYELTWRVDPAQKTQSGDEAIRIEVSGHPSSVVIHAVDLTLSEASVEQGGKRQSARIAMHPESETVELRTATPLAPGEAVVRLHFAGKLREDLRGLYFVKSATGDPAAVSQFEATDARRAFPCYDEPGFKATYAITAVIPDGMSAVSNGAEQVGNTDFRTPSGTHAVFFEETKPISSYLVALAVGKFASIETVVAASQNHVKVRVLAPPGQEGLGTFALQMAARVIPFYERYFGLPFPFSKLDMLAVPDFDAGGMENAGAIFYRDTALLLDDKAASVQARKRVGVVVVHEIAHQWFGDLVTMAWWDDLWLNEAFASLMEGVSLEALEPDWNPWSDVQLATMGVLETDALQTSHPIHVPVATADEANALFDDITYSKGAAVLRMLQLYLTPELWRLGVGTYLKGHMFGNATETDLWQALSLATHEDVQKVAASWFDQTGYPLLTAARVGAQLKLSQTPFASGAAGSGPAVWQVPICVDSEKTSAQHCTLLAGASGHLELEQGDGWIDANGHESGFYRTDYDPALWSPLADAFERPDGHGPDGPERMGLLADAYWLSLVKEKPVDHLLTLISRLGAERDDAVWTEALGILRQLEERVASPEDRGRWRSVIADLLRPAATELGWKDAPADSPGRRSLRAQVLSGLTDVADDPKIVKEARAHLTGFESGSEQLDLTLLPLVLDSAARHGDAALWVSFRKKMDSASTPELQERYRLALAAFADPALVQRTLAMTLDGELRKQDIARELAAALENADARAATLDFLLANWGRLKDRLGESATWSLLPAMGDFCSMGTRDRLKVFFDDPKNHIEGGDRVLRQGLERIALCARFKEAHAAELSRWVQTAH